MKKILIFLLFSSFALQAQKDKAKTSNIDKIIAKVDNYYILKSDVETIILQNQEQGQVVDRCKALESIAVQKLLVAKAEIDSVIVEDDMVNGQLDARMDQMIRIYGGEENIVEQFNKSLASLKSEVRTEVKEQLTAEKMQRTITETDRVTPIEVRRFFNKIPKDSIPMLPAEVKVAQIVRLGIVTQAIKSELVDKLKKFKTEIDKGADFAELAKEHSEDPGSRPTGGDLGWAKRGQMVPAFEAAAMSLKPGEVSDVIESDYGFHLIKLKEIRGQEYQASHILLRPDYNRLDMDKPTAYLDSVRTFLVSDSLKINQAVKLHSEDESTKDMGGIISDPRTGANKLALDASMEPTLYFALDTMKVGDFTQPLPYRTQEGKTGMRILYLKDKYEPHKASVEEDYEKIKEYALAEKNSKTIEKWFKEAIGEVYIKIDDDYKSCRLFEL